MRREMLSKSHRWNSSRDEIDRCADLDFSIFCVVASWDEYVIYNDRSLLKSGRTDRRETSHLCHTPEKQRSFGFWKGAGQEVPNSFSYFHLSFTVVWHTVRMSDGTQCTVYCVLHSFPLWTLWSWLASPLWIHLASIRTHSPASFDLSITKRLGHLCCASPCCLHRIAIHYYQSKLFFQSNTWIAWWVHKVKSAKDGWINRSMDRSRQFLCVM